jgi:hypothetical protein
MVYCLRLWSRMDSYVRSMKSSCLRIRLSFLFVFEACSVHDASERNISSALIQRGEIREIAFKEIGSRFAYGNIFECSDVKVLHGIVLDRKWAVDGFHGCDVSTGDRAL